MDASSHDEVDLDPCFAESLLQAVQGRLLDYLSALPSQPAARLDPAPRELLEGLREPAPREGTPIEEILDVLFGQVIPCSFNTAGPGYLAYIPGGGLLSAAVADYLAAAVNRYTGVWVAAPAAVEIETQALGWLADFLGYPAGTRGVLTTGGSMSNVLAFVAAREKLLDGDLSRGTVYVSAEVHHSVTKAARVAGVPAGNIRRIPVDARFRMRSDILEETLRADRRAGRKPFFICGSAGTINTGSVDPLEALGEVASREGLWFHVDGAYGGVFRALEDLRPVLAGMERADSTAVDPHKGLFLAYGTGALLVRNLDDLRRAFGSQAAYLPQLQGDDEHIDYCEVSPELSRDWRGLRLWLPFKLHGLESFRRALREKRELAVRMWSRLDEEDDLEIAAPPELSLFAFRQRFPGCDVAEANRRNRDLLERINRRGRIMITGTEIAGAFYLRIVVLHLRTHVERVEEALAAILAEVAAGRR